MLNFTTPKIDHALGGVSLLCFMVGVPGNILATIYFIKEHLNNVRNNKKLFFTELYLFMTTIDLLLTVTMVPVFEAYFTGRAKPVLFMNTYICAIWGFLWEVLPYYSVFLVGVLSMSRMVVLVKPMMKLDIKMLRLTVGLYAFFHIAFKAILWIKDVATTGPSEWNTAGTFSYTSTSMYCYIAPEAYILWVVSAWVACILLGLPLIPISVSFIMSLMKLRASARTSSSQNFSRAAQNHATTTIIIVTTVYLVCNLPVFINYAYYIYPLSKDVAGDYTVYNSTYGASYFMWYYVWNITYALCVAVNATLNPIVFFCRMKPFREFVLSLVRVCLPTKTARERNGAVSGLSMKDVTTSSF